MTPPVYPLTVFQGDTGHWRMVLWLDRDKTIPIDLTGIVVEARMKATLGEHILITAVTLPNIIEVTLPAPMSRDLPSASNWTLKLIKPENEIQTICRGPVRVMADA